MHGWWQPGTAVQMLSRELESVVAKSDLTALVSFRCAAVVVNEPHYIRHHNRNTYNQHSPGVLLLHLVPAATATIKIEDKSVAKVVFWLVSDPTTSTHVHTLGE
jgi:hypothetical protein